MRSSTHHDRPQRPHRSATYNRTRCASSGSTRARRAISRARFASRDRSPATAGSTALRSRMRSRSSTRRVAIGVEQFSFTGGEPFIVKGFVDILKYASRFRPCLVLTNGTDAVLKRLRQIAELRSQPHPVAFRVSIDYADRARHDSGRGAGSFDKSWSALERCTSSASRCPWRGRSRKARTRRPLQKAFAALFAAHGLPPTTTLVGFPDFGFAGRASDGADGHRALHDHVSVRGDAPRVHVRVLEDGHQEGRPHARLRVHARRRRRLATTSAPP